MRFVGIDPSTKTGLVIINTDGEIINAEEITAKSKDPERMVSIIDGVMGELSPGDDIAIEGFAYGANGNAISIQYGLGWGLRMALYTDKYSYLDVPPTSLKKFASGRGNTKKDELAVHIFKRWGFEHKSDNVRDAFVLAHIARLAHLKGRSGINLPTHQQDALKAILEPHKVVAK